MRQKLGQHFLKNDRKLKVIAGALDINSADIVVEVGPGHGELTRHLLKAGANVFAIEKDDELVKKLSEKFENCIKDNKLKIISGDALDILSDKDFYKFVGKSYKIVGNIPYYITGHLLRVIGEINVRPESVVLLIQKEVAERICAKKVDMNLLSASVQVWADVKIVGEVSKRYFSPLPKIDSAILLLKSKDIKQLEKIDIKKYYEFVHIIFKQPRKTIRNNLHLAGYETKKIDEILNGLFAEPNDIRAHQLNIEDIIHLMTSF